MFSRYVIQGTAPVPLSNAAFPMSRDGELREPRLLDGCAYCEAFVQALRVAPQVASASLQMVQFAVFRRCIHQGVLGPGANVSVMQ